MKKVLLLIFCLFLINKVEARELVSFSKCVDGDTIKVIYKQEEVTVRLLSIDTPETKHPTKQVEKYGKEASDYTCNKIKTAKILELEFDDNSEKLDKYNRYLAWVFTDNNLLQQELLNLGYAKIDYVYGDYKYKNELKFAELKAKSSKLGIHEEYNIYKDIVYYGFLVIVIIIIFIIGTKKQKNQLTKKIIKKLKNSI